MTEVHMYPKGNDLEATMTPSTKYSFGFRGCREQGKHIWDGYIIEKDDIMYVVGRRTS